MTQQEQKDTKPKLTQHNRKFFLICPYDHRIDRVSSSVLLPIYHVHNYKLYELYPFHRMREVMYWLRRNRPLKENER